jgi:hypothetical protein
VSTSALPVVEPNIDDLIGWFVSKIKVSGRLSGKWRSRGLVRRLRVPVCARVRAGQTIYLGLQNCTVIHGREKVYGSIP